MPALETSDAMLLLWAALGYLLGSVPFGLLISRWLGLGNLRQIGSGNIGATNVLRTGSKRAAAATLLLDGAKGAAAVLLARAFAAEDAAQVAGLAAFLGHCFPVWLGFRGGKGVATFLGLWLALAWPWGWPVAQAGRGRGGDADFVDGGADGGGVVDDLAVPVGLYRYIRVGRGADAAGLCPPPGQCRPPARGDRAEDRAEIGRAERMGRIAEPWCGDPATPFARRE